MDLLPIVGPGVHIDRLAPGDADALSASHSDPANARFQAWQSPLSRTDAVAFIEEMATSVVLVDPAGSQLAIRERAGGELAGDLFVVRSPSDPTVVEVGITLVPGWHGRGLATAAVTALLGALFGDRELGVARVDGYLDADNHRSAALFERLSFLPVARLEGAATRRDGSVADELHYAIDRATWVALHRGDP